MILYCINNKDTKLRRGIPYHAGCSTTDLVQVAGTWYKKERFVSEQIYKIGERLRVSRKIGISD